MELVSENGLDVRNDACKRGGMRGCLEGFEEGLALAGRNVELAGSIIREVCLYDMLDLFAEWLDGDWAFVRSIND
jgi:hypothetical protein